MALGDVSPERDNLLAGSPVSAPDDLEQARREADERLDLERQINFAIDEINANPNIPSEIKTELVNNLRSLKTGLGANPNLAQVQKEINEARATAQHVATSNAIYDSLSAAGQAAVNARVNALGDGRYSDYYLSKTQDIHAGYSDAALADIARQVDADAVFQSRMKIVAAAPEEVRRSSEAELQANLEYIQTRQAAADTPEERELWQKLLGMPMVQRQRFRSDLENINSLEELRAFVSSVETAEISNMAERFSDPDIDAQCRQGLRNYYASADGYGIDYERIFRDMNAPENQAKMAAARDTYARAHNDLSQVAPELRQFVVLSLAREYRMADAQSQNSVFAIMRQSYLDHAHQGEEHQADWNQIIDNTLPFEQRVTKLEEELKEHGFGNPSSPNYQAEIQQIARNAIATLQLSDDPRAEITGRSSAAITRLNIRSQAMNAIIQSGISQDDAQAYLRQYSSMGALLPLASAADNEEARQAIRNDVNLSLSINTNEAIRPALSRIRYYNLNDSEQGRALSSRIIYGQLDPVEAESQAIQLQAAVVLRMNNYESLVNHFVTAPEHVGHAAISESRMEPTDYQVRLTALGMYNADGSLNVEKIIETARINRDRLDAQNLAAAQAANGTMNDAQLSTVTNRAYADLPEELKDARVVARTAARFKAIEAIQMYGREIGAALERIEENGLQASPELLAEQQNYRNMTNADGSVSPEVQRAAIERLLNQQQYFRTTQDLREIVTENLIELSHHNPEILLGYEFTNNQRVWLAHAEAQPVNISAEEVYALRNEGKNANRLFGTQIESNIRQALQGQEMADIVRIFGNYMTGADGTQFNSGNLNNISVYELQNALMGTNQVTKGSDRDRVFAETDINHDGKLSISELVERLRANGDLATSVAGGQGVASNSTPAAQAVPSAAGPASQLPTPGR